MSAHIFIVGQRVQSVMKRILLWLPIVDVFALRNILAHYSSMGVEIPPSHARLAMLERWLGYLPIGFATCRFLGPLASALIALAVLVFVGPIELRLMLRGSRPWKFLARKPRKVVTKIFLLESYNLTAYYALGVLVAWLVRIFL